MLTLTLSVHQHTRATPVHGVTSIGLRTCRRMKLCAPKTVISRLTGSQKGFNRAFQTNRALNFACWSSSLISRWRLRSPVLFCGTGQQQEGYSHASCR